jgi:hypothetical protein
VYGLLLRRVKMNEVVYIGTDVKMPEILSKAIHSLNTSRRTNKNYLSVNGQEDSAYLDKIGWEAHEKDIFEWGVYTGLELVKKQAELMLKMP